MTQRWYSYLIINCKNSLSVLASDPEGTGNFSPLRWPFPSFEEILFLPAQLGHIMKPGWQPFENGYCPSYAPTNSCPPPPHSTQQAAAWPDHRGGAGNWRENKPVTWENKLRASLTIRVSLLYLGLKKQKTNKKRTQCNCHKETSNYFIKIE